MPRDHVAGWEVSRRFWRRPAIAGLRIRERPAVPELSWTFNSVIWKMPAAKLNCLPSSSLNM